MALLCHVTEKSLPDWQNKYTTVCTQIQNENFEKYSWQAGHCLGLETKKKKSCEKFSTTTTRYKRWAEEWDVLTNLNMRQNTPEEIKYRLKYKRWKYIYGNLLNDCRGVGRNHTYQHEVHKDMEFDFLKYIYLQSGISGNHYFLQFSTFATFMRWNSSSFCYKRISQTWEL